jgi:hypothetical protein
MKNRIRIYPEGYAGIDLGKGFETKVDVEDLPKLIEIKWRPMSTQTNKSGPYVRAIGRTRGVEFFLHRYLYSAVGPEFRDIEIDHINGDPLDNRRNNLRPATRQQNRANTRKSNPFKGAYKHHNKWHARIRHGGVTHYLGAFSTPEQAAQAYNNKAIEFHKEFANLNKL